LCESDELLFGRCGGAKLEMEEGKRVLAQIRSISRCARLGERGAIVMKDRGLRKPRLIGLARGVLAARPKIRRD